LRRVGLLFQRYFVERFRSELIYWGIMAIVFMFLRNNIPGMFGFILVAGVFYAARFFKEIHHSGNGIAYFMIPATQLEKLAVAIVITTLYYFAMMTIVYVIGNLAGTFLNNMLASMDYLPNKLLHHSSLQWKLFEETGVYGFAEKFDIKNMLYIVSIFRSFLFFQPLFLFGGIYFRKNQAFKTFAAIILSYVLLAIIIQIEAKLIFGDALPTGESVKHWFWTFVNTVKIFHILLPFYFWVVSYFRLTEKQV
jgi:hypothetical protein